MWLSEPTEAFPLTHGVEPYLILGQYNVMITGRIKAFYVEMSLNCNILASIFKLF